MRPEQRRIGFLGLGLMAKAPALVLKSLGFPVSAWVRSPRADEEIPIFHGADQFERFMNQTDIAVCLLPLTRETEGILCARTFAMMPRGAMVINIGRGKHVVEADLIAALDSGQLSYAALDALYPEPLPPESPLWLHPKVTVMPHVARRPTVRAARHRDRRQYQKHRGRRRAAAGNRQADRVLAGRPGHCRCKAETSATATSISCTWPLRRMLRRTALPIPTCCRIAVSSARL